MESWLWKWVWRASLLVAIIAGVVTIATNVSSGQVSTSLIYWLLGACILLGIIGLFLDFKPRREFTRPREAVGIPSGRNPVDEIAFFVGTWQVGDGRQSGRPFYIELRDGGDARRYSSNGAQESACKWEYDKGEVICRWHDGWADTLRCTPTGVIKLASKDGPATAGYDLHVEEAVKRP
jgi:hypothetical protein